MYVHGCVCVCVYGVCVCVCLYHKVHFYEYLQCQSLMCAHSCLNVYVCVCVCVCVCVLCRRMARAWGKRANVPAARAAELDQVGSGV
jgi:hypothetical protein